MDAGAEPLTYILNHYRDRIENNEEERRKWYNTLGKLRIPQDYEHKLRWEFKKRTDELQEIEGALKDAHIALYDYRDKITTIKEQNDHLIIKQGDNSRAIKDLLALNNSVEQHVHFSEGVTAEKLSSYAKTNSGANVHQRDKENIKGI